MKKLAILFFITQALISNEIDKFILMIPLYREKNETRKQEYMTCLERNLAHSRIKHIHVLYDQSKDLKREGSLLRYLHTKPISITYINRRQSFEDFFGIANAHYKNQKIILANADIYFNETLFLLDDYDLTNKFLALTRWEDLNGKLELQRIYNIELWLSHCQDVWIFMTPIMVKKASQISIGTIGCDPYIARRAQESGLEVINPCLSIQCCHLHASGIRHYDQNAAYDVKRGKELVVTTLQ